MAFHRGQGCAALVALVCALCPRAGAEAAGAPTIAVEIYVFGPAAHPVTDLTPGDPGLFQDGVAQAIEGLAPRGEPGRYELRYRPASGRPGAMKLQAVRKGLVVRAPDGSERLQPRVLSAPSPLEAELLQALAARPDAREIAFRTGILDYEAGPDGLHTTVAVELGLRDLLGERASAHLQMLVQLSQAGGFVHNASFERALEASSGLPLLVWTVHQHLAPGAYAVDTVVREAATGRLSVESRRFEVPTIAAGLRLGSPAWLQPFPAELLTGPAHDEPLAAGGQTLMPAIDPVLQRGAAALFFVPVYPDPANAAPVSLELELLRDGRSVGKLPLSLPAPEAGGRIAFRGRLQTRTLSAPSYVVRFLARQGEASATREMALRLADEVPQAPLRIGSRP